MQIVIDIPEGILNTIQADEMISREQLAVLQMHILNGTPLPKEHGRLIDADELEELFGEECVGDCGACLPKRKTDGRGRWYDTCLLIDNAPTIIEADKEE